MLGMDGMILTATGYLKNTIPSVLVETGCLINPANETFLASEAGENEFASNIFEAMQATV
jgi:N-acetylmuramoyl-L-alanine amidase|tara:strand:+ start:4680 stop:4859 length:180 start_codon:yes stop_codon:yes gene_type:complete